MRNQTSFRLTTTLLPTDTSAKTTDVINKVDSCGCKFKPTFTEETVILTNDDRTVMETTRAYSCDGAICFTKRGLSDDVSETEVANRKLSWNPGTLAFITAGAGDYIDKDDDVTWTGNQTYTGNLTSCCCATYCGDATYKGQLTTEKGVKYPSFADVTALQSYASPFGGMFATVNDTGELYRYNSVTCCWDMVSTVALGNYIFRECSTKPSPGTASNVVTMSTAQHGIYLGEDEIIDKDYVETYIKGEVPQWVSTGTFLRTAAASGEAHSQTIGTSLTYTFQGLGYVVAKSFYGYALEINGIQAFYESFSSGTYSTKYPGSIYTMGPGDVVKIWRPGSSGSFSGAVVDYY